MWKIQASEAKTHLPRLVPVTTRREADIRAAIAEILELRRTRPVVLAAERRAMIDEGRKY